MSILAFSDVFDLFPGAATVRSGDKNDQLEQRRSVWDALRRAPKIDVVETEQEYIVKADIPGLKKVAQRRR
ncbi:hypothetical protein BDK51DRAFT_51523 [Blyttiomyces helicus]|uniref:Uncharacterized protein n=1 Tax=Blyttiomyces helicus TaxID=388810 RepID=A0A4P9W5A1_9FUNG|nr:hypothetical protein BDK51DRAFT_51523 [Blyttiomyces helicus]|eukprot:RKO85920.1 hypothetical protein BDK51DRAFT_51523 [Blyttiomyces helicus]